MATKTPKDTSKKSKAKKTRAVGQKPNAKASRATAPEFEPQSSYEKAFDEAMVGRLLHDESEADEDGFIAGAGFDRYGGFPGDGLS